MIRHRRFDGLRGLMACSVVIFHSFPTVYIIPGLSWAWNGKGAVIGFFVLSGLVLSLALDADPAMSWRGFVLRRLLRLWPPYAAAVLLACALSGEWRGFWIALAGLEPPPEWVANGTFWTITLELHAAFVFPLLHAAVRRWGALVPLGLLALQVPIYLAGSPISTPAKMVDCLALMAVGSWLAPHTDRLKHCPALPRCVILAAALGAASIILHPWNFDARWIAVDAGMIAIVAFAPACLEREAPVAMGRVSFSLYLVHEPVFNAAMKALTECPITLMRGLPEIVRVEAAWIVVAASAVIFYLAVEAPVAALVRRSIRDDLPAICGVAQNGALGRRNAAECVQRISG